MMFEELSRPISGDEVVPLYQGEIGEVDAEFRFIDAAKKKG